MIGRRIFRSNESDSIDEALADLEIHIGNSNISLGDSNDSSFDSSDVLQASNDAQYVNCLENNRFCRIDNPLAEILLSVDKTPTSALPTPNTSPVTKDDLNSDERSIDLMKDLHASLRDDDSHVTVPTQNQLRQMSDSLSDIMDVSEIASLKRPIPISPSQAHLQKSSSCNKKLFLTPLPLVNDNMKPHSC